MNKDFLLLLFLLLAISCVGKYNSNSQSATIREARLGKTAVAGDSLNISPVNSKIYWKGTKMRGVGKHEGEIQLKSGYFITKNQEISGGEFIIDMTSIRVTDIPEHEPIPRNNLNNHLKSADFFEVEKYPTAKFEISKIETLVNDSIKLAGNMTIKDITRSIEFLALGHSRGFSTVFTFDRFLWNIAYEGNWANKTLVDKDIELRIELVKQQ